MPPWPALWCGRYAGYGMEVFRDAQERNLDART